MRRNAIIIGIFTLILICIGTYIGLSLGEETEVMPFSLIVSTDEREISLWQDEEGYYAFIPSYVNPADMTVHLEVSTPIYLDGEAVSEGMRLLDIALDAHYELKVGDDVSEITFLRSEDTATVYIDTFSGSMDSIHADKQNSESAEIMVVDSDGVLNYDGEIESFGGHGNSTWTDSEKKPYNIRLSDEADLLGMGVGKRWILLANSFDRTGMRNTIAYDFSRDMGVLSPDSRYVTLYLNGEYAGVYQLCERNEVYPGRIGETEECFLVSMEYQSRLEGQGYPHVITENAQALRIHHSTVSEERVGQIWQSIENAILADDGIDPITDKHLFELIDLDSWARKYIIEETFCSIDACFISQYFYWNGDRVIAGPVWDFDTSMGREGMPALQSPYALLANRPQARAESMTPWFYHLYKNDEFYARVTELYEREFMPALRRLLDEDISALREEISAAWQVDSVRWHDGEDSGEYIDTLTSYLSRRIEFLEEIWIEGREYHTVTFIPKFSYYSYVTAYDGESLEDVPKLDNTPEFTFMGWYYQDSDEPFDPEAPITEDITVYALYTENGKGALDSIAKLLPLGIFALIFMSLAIGLLMRYRRCKK